MICNGKALTSRSNPPIKNMMNTKIREHGVSYGLSEAGYDIRIKQDLTFNPVNGNEIIIIDGKSMNNTYGRFTIASAIEEFDMPSDLVGVVHDKSTWARKGVSVFNTVIEPGWKGFLTLELVFHGNERVHIPAGAGIAQVIFHKTQDLAEYDGKYQNAGDFPQEAKS